MATSTQARPETGALVGQRLADSLAQTWAAYEAEGIPVISIVDTPRPQFDVPACVAENASSLAECTFSRREAQQYPSIAAQRRAAELAKVDSVDLFDWICPGKECAPVIGGVLVYRDNNHLTATYSRSLADALSRQMAPLATQP